MRGPGLGGAAFVATAVLMFWVCDAGSSKISSVSLLLPLDKSDSADAGEELLSVSQWLTASPGCYEWVSTDPDMVDIVESSIETSEANAQCEHPLASRVMINVINSNQNSARFGGSSNYKSRCEIIALDPSTDEQLTVEVYVKPIHRIEILTTVRRLALFEPETIKVQAFDEKGNVFSSLDRLSFSWESSESTSSSADNSPLAVKKISETQVFPSHGLQQEYFGRFGYKVQIAGKRAGRGTIRASLIRPANGEYSEISSQVDIDVVEPLLLCPSSPVLVVGSWTKVRAMRKSSKVEYELIDGNDNGRYEWVIGTENEKLSVDSESGVLVAKEPVVSSLVFQQKGYETNSVQSNVKVVELDRIKLWFAPFEAPKRGVDAREMTSCPWSTFARSFPQDKELPARKQWHSMDLDRWVLTIGRRYYIMSTLFSDAVNETQSIFVTEAMEFDFSAVAASAPQSANKDNAGGAIAFLSESDSGYSPRLASVRVVQATKVGYVDLTVEFGMGEPAPLSGSPSEAYPKSKWANKVLQITDKIGLWKETIRLPVDPSNRVFHSYRLNATGGTGFYTCETPKQKGCAIAVTDAHECIVRVRDNLAGNETVQVRDTYDSLNTKAASVIVSAPSSLRFSQEHIYVAIADEFVVPVFFNDAYGLPYDNCTGFYNTIEWEVEGSRSVVDIIKGKQAVKRQASGVCSSRTLRALEAGGATVSARYNGQLVATLRITVSEKVHVVTPVPNVELDTRGMPAALVLVGQATTLTVAGGKLKDDIALYSTSDGEAILLARDEWESHLAISAGSRDRSKRRSYQVLCVKEGQFEILVQSHAQAVIICAYSDALLLTLRASSQQRTAFEEADCSEKQADRGGAMSSSLLMSDTFHVVNTKLEEFPVLARVLDARGRAFTDIGSLAVKWSLSPETSELVWAPQAASGVLTAPAGFEKTLQIHAELTIPRDGTDDQGLQADLTIDIVDDLDFEPGVLRTALADPNTEFGVIVSGGAQMLVEQGRLECKSTRLDVALVSLSGRLASVHYVAQGKGSSGEWQFRSSNLVCTLDCLVGSKPISVSTDFSRVSRLSISAPHKVREGEVTQIEVQAYDAAEQPFSGNMHDYVGLHLGSAPEGAFDIHAIEAAECVPGADSEKAVCDGRFSVTVQGRVAGAAVLRAETGDRLSVVEQSITVYKGVQLVPASDQVIEPGATFRVGRSYGPFADPSRCDFDVEGDKKDPAVIVKDKKAGVFFARRLGAVTIRAVCRGDDGAIIDSASLTAQVRFYKEMNLIPAKMFVPQGKTVRVRVGFPEVLNKPINFDSIFRDFEWKVADDEIAEIVKGPKVDALDSGVYSLWVKGLAPGETSIKVISICNTELSKESGVDSKLVAEAPFAVEHALELESTLASASVADSAITLLMPRQGELRLVTALDSHWQKGTLVGKPASLSFFVSSRGCFASGASSASDDGTESPKETSGALKNLLRVEENGLIVTSESTGSAEVVIQLRSEYRGIEIVQQIAVHIVVAHVAFVGAKQLHHELLFPVGIPRTIQVELFDSNGRVFAAPFSTLDVSVGVSDAAKLSIRPAALPPRGAGSNRVSSFEVLALEEGRSNLVVSLDGDSAAREDYLEVHSIAASTAFHFELADTSESGLIIVPGDTIAVPLAVSSALFLSEGVPVRCAVVLDGVNLQSSIESSAPGAKGDPWATCKFDSPSASAKLLGTPNSSATLTLFASNAQVHSVTVPVTFSFRLDSKQVAIKEGSSFDWDLSTDKVEFQVLGLADDSLVTAKSASPSLVKVVSTSPVILQRAQNGTCDRSATIIFVHSKTGQRVDLQARFTCIARGGLPTKQGRLFLLPSLPSDIKLQIVLPLALGFLVIMYWFLVECCGTSNSSRVRIGTTADRSSESFGEMDNPSRARRGMPKLPSQNGIGSPMRDSLRYRGGGSPFVH